MSKEFTATARVVLDMPRAEAWQRMRDLRLAKYYVPGLVDCRLMTEQATGVGTSRKVYMRRFEMDETVVEWTEGEGFVLRLHNGERSPMIFARAFAHYHIDDSPDGGTLLEHSLRYVMRGGFLGALFARLCFHRVMVKSATDVAVNLEKFYRTGQSSNKAWSGGHDSVEGGGPA